MKNITFITACCALTLTAFNAYSQTITTVVGNGYYHGTGSGAYSGDGGQATAAELFGPENLVFDKGGNYYITDEENDVIRKVNTSGVITTIAGIGGVASYYGDGGPATAAELRWPRMIIIDTAGNIYFDDYVNNRIREINISTGIITTIAGNGTGDYSGDNGPATAAELHGPNGIGFNKQGNLYIADGYNYRIREVNGATGIITTIAGNGANGFYGDGGPATAAEFDYVYGLALDSSGNVYVADQDNYCVRKITISTGIISTVAGIAGTTGYTGNGGQATAAELSDSVIGIAIDKNGNLYIGDGNNQCIRMVTTSGIISTIAGNTVEGYSGDGGLATAAEMYIPLEVAFDKHGNMYIPDWVNNVIREVTNVVATGIKEVKNDGGVSIFPNPANEQLFVTLNGITGKVILTLYTIQGEEMTKQIFSNQPKLTLNTSGFSNGLYLLRIQKEDGSIVGSGKVIIQK